MSLVLSSNEIAANINKFPLKCHDDAVESQLWLKFPLKCCTPKNALLNQQNYLTKANNVQSINVQANRNFHLYSTNDEPQKFPFFQQSTKNDDNKFPLTMHQYQNFHSTTFRNDLSMRRAAATTTETPTITHHGPNLATLHGQTFYNVDEKLEKRQHQWQQEAQVHCVQVQRECVEAQERSSSSSTASTSTTTHTSKYDEAADDGIATRPTAGEFITMDKSSKLEIFSEKASESIVGGPLCYQTDTHNIHDERVVAVVVGVDCDDAVGINESAPPLIYDDNELVIEIFHNAKTNLDVANDDIDDGGGGGGDDYDDDDDMACSSVGVAKQQQTLLAQRNYYSDVRDTSSKEVLAVIAATSKDNQQPASNEINETPTARQPNQPSKSNLNFTLNTLTSASHAVDVAASQIPQAPTPQAPPPPFSTTNKNLNQPSVDDKLPNFELLPNYYALELVASNERNWTETNIAAAAADESATVAHLSSDKSKNNSNINAQQSIIASDVRYRHIQFNAQQEIPKWLINTNNTFISGNSLLQLLRRAFSEMTLTKFEEILEDAAIVAAAAATAAASSSATNSSSEPASPISTDEQALDEMKFEMRATKSLLQQPTTGVKPNERFRHERSGERERERERERRTSNVQSLSSSTTPLLRISRPQTINNATDKLPRSGIALSPSAAITANSNTNKSSSSSNLQQCPTDQRWSSNYKSTNEPLTRRENDMKRSVSMDTVGKMLPSLATSSSRTSLLRRQRRMASQDSIDKDEDPIVRLNRLRARISGALTEVKGVLNKYSTETEPAAETVTSRIETARPIQAPKPWEQPKPWEATKTNQGSNLSIKPSIKTVELSTITTKAPKPEEVSTTRIEVDLAAKSGDTKKPLEASETSDSANKTEPTSETVESITPLEVPKPTDESTDNKTNDDGPVKFRFVRKVRRRSVFLEEDESKDNKAEAQAVSEISKNTEGITGESQSSEKDLKISQEEVTKHGTQQQTEENVVANTLREAPPMQPIDDVKPQQITKKESEEAQNLERTLKLREENTINVEREPSKDSKQTIVIKSKRELPKIEIRQASKESLEPQGVSKSKLKITERAPNRRASTGAIKEPKHESDDVTTLELNNSKKQRRPSDATALIMKGTKIDDEKSKEAKLTPKTAEQQIICKVPGAVKEPEKIEKINQKKRIVLKRGESLRRASIAAVEKSKIEPPIKDASATLHEVKTQRRPSDVTVTAATSTTTTTAIEPKPAMTTAKAKLIMRRPTPRVRVGAKANRSVPSALSSSSSSTLITANETNELALDESREEKLIKDKTAVADASSAMASAALSAPPKALSSSKSSSLSSPSLPPPPPVIDKLSTIQSNSIANETIKGTKTSDRQQQSVLLASTPVPASLVPINVPSGQQKAQTIDTTSVKNFSLSPTPASPIIIDTNRADELIKQAGTTHAKSSSNRDTNIADINEPIHQRIESTKIPAASFALTHQRAEQQQVAINVDNVVDPEIATKAANVEVNSCSGPALATKTSSISSASSSPSADATKSARHAAEIHSTAQTTINNEQQQLVVASASVIESKMPELQISPAPVKAVRIPAIDKRKFAPLNLPREELPKPKITFKKIVRQKLLDKPKQHATLASNKKSVGTSTTPIKVVEPQAPVEPTVETIAEVVPPPSEAPIEEQAPPAPLTPPPTPPPPEKQPRKIKKKVIIKRQQRRLSVSDQTFFNSDITGNEQDEQNANSQPDYETLERAIAYVTDDEDDDADANEALPALPLKGCMRQREFEVGELVMYAERYKRTQVRWKKGRVLERITSISYKLDIDGKEVAAHISYIKRYTDRKVSFGGKEYLEIEYEQVADESEKRRSYSIWNMV